MVAAIGPRRFCDPYGPSCYGGSGFERGAMLGELGLVVGDLAQGLAASQSAQTHGSCRGAAATAQNQIIGDASDDRTALR